MEKDDFINFPVRVPEDSEAFKEWKERQRTGEEPPKITIPKVSVDVPVRIPEESDAFKEWERSHGANPTDTSED